MKRTRQNKFPWFPRSPWEPFRKRSAFRDTERSRLHSHAERGNDTTAARRRSGFSRDFNKTTHATNTRGWISKAHPANWRQNRMRAACPAGLGIVMID